MIRHYTCGHTTDRTPPPATCPAVWGCAGLLAPFFLGAQPLAR